MELTVIQGKDKHKIVVSENDTVASVRQAIHELLGVPVEVCRLIFKGKECSTTEASLAACGTKSGAKLMLLFKAEYHIDAAKAKANQKEQQERAEAAQVAEQMKEAASAPPPPPPPTAAAAAGDAAAAGGAGAVSAGDTDAFWVQVLRGKEKLRVEVPRDALFKAVKAALYVATRVPAKYHRLLVKGKERADGER